MVTAPQGMRLRAVQRLNHPEGVYQALFGASDRQIITRCKDGKIRVWNRQTGQLQTILSGNNRPVGGKGNSSQMLPTGQGKIFAPMQQMTLNHNGQVLTSIDSNQQIWIWNLQSGQLQTRLDSEGIQLTSRRSASTNSILTALSPNQQILVTVDSQPSTQGQFNAYLWDSHTGKQMGRLPGHAQPITSVQFSADGTYIITASLDGTVRLWATEIGGELPSVQLPGPVTSMAFLPSQLIQSSASVQSGDVAVQPVQQAPGWLTMGNQIAGWQNWLPSKFNLAGRPHNTLAAPSHLDSAAQDSSRTLINRLVTMGQNGQLQHLQVVTHLSASSASGAAIPSAQPSSPLAALVQSRWNGFNQQRSETARLGFTEFLQRIASGQMADAVSLPAKLDTALDPGLGQSLQTRTALSSSAMSADGQTYATADIAGRVALYRVEAGRVVQPLSQIQNWQANAGQTDTSASEVVVTPDSGPGPNSTPQSPTAIRQLVFSPDGQQLLGIADDLTIRIWAVSSGQLIQVFRGHTATIRQANYSQDGRWIISASWDRTARIWDTATGQISQILPHADAVSSAHFSPDGSRVVTANWSGKIQLWLTKTGKNLISFETTSKAAIDVQFSPTGQQFATVHTDGTAHLWDAATGADLAVLRSAPQSGSDDIIRAFFSPDGQYIATLTQQGRVSLWAATATMLLQLARERTVRQLTPEECNQYLRVPAAQCPPLP